MFAKDSMLHCQHGILQPGEMLFIPAFYWHQVTALDTSISVNMFYGDSGEHEFIDKILHRPYFEYFRYWFLNIIQQNRKFTDSFDRMLSRLPEVLFHFFVKQWHEYAKEVHVEKCVEMVLEYCQLKQLPCDELFDSNSPKAKFPPVLKIRGLLNRNGTESYV